MNISLALRLFLCETLNEGTYPISERDIWRVDVGRELDSGGLIYLGLVLVFQ